MKVFDKRKINRLLFGSQYNAHNATSKVAFPGKLIAIYKIRKIRNQWQKTDSIGLKKLKGKHKDAKRVFVICNGPSLNKIDLNKLKDEVTIGANALYLNFDNMGFKPTYYIVEDNLVGEDRGNRINEISNTTKLIAQRLAYCIKRNDNTLFLNHSPDVDPWLHMRQREKLELGFTRDASIATFSGNTVTYTMLQIAWHIGAREVYIIGADHNYQVPEKYKNKKQDENFIIDSPDNDPNHFHPDYFGKGYRWHNPKLHLLEKSYKNAKRFFEFNGGMIFNATKGGHLEIFPRVDYEDLFKSDFVNSSFIEYLKNYRKQHLIPGLEYRGNYLSFSGKDQLSKSFDPSLVHNYEFEIMIRSLTEGDFYGPYSDTSPPMPLIIEPFRLLQMQSCEFKLYFSKNFEPLISIEGAAWFKIRIVGKKENQKTQIFINDQIIDESNEFYPLKGKVSLGKGIGNRYWKGNIAWLKLYSLNNNQQKKLTLSMSEQAK